MDQDEAARLAERFAPAVYRLAYARTGSRADAEDVMQETFLRLLTAQPKLKDDDHARAWLLRVAAQRSADHFRALRRRREAPLTEAEDLPGPEPPEEGRALAAVLALPVQYRAPIHLFYYEGLSVAQIAAVLGKSEGAVKTRLSRGRALLRKIMSEGDERLV